MSRSRWGGFRRGRLILTQWDKLVSPSAESSTAPEKIQDFDYSTSQGIWNLRSTTQFNKKTASSFTFVDSSISSTTNVSFPVDTQAGDLVILIEFSTTVSPSTPAGWTNINQASTTGALGVCSYKIVTSSDLSSSVSGITGTTRKTMLVFRPNGVIKEVSVGSIAGQATTAAPTNQTLSMSGIVTPVIGIVHYASTAAIGTRGSAGLTMTEISNTTSQYTRYVIFNTGSSPSDGTISMADAGTNALQSFYLQVL